MQPFYLVVLAASAARPPSHDAATARRARSGHHPPGAFGGLWRVPPCHRAHGRRSSGGTFSPAAASPAKTFHEGEPGRASQMPGPGKSGTLNRQQALLTATGRAWQVGLARSVWGRGRADHAVRPAPRPAFTRARANGGILRRRRENLSGSSRNGHTPAKLRPPTCRPVNVRLTTPPYGSILGARVGEIR
jgi:hypothetical protein